MKRTETVEDLVKYLEMARKMAWGTVIEEDARLGQWGFDPSRRALAYGQAVALDDVLERLKDLAA